MYNKITKHIIKITNTSAYVVLVVTNNLIISNIKLLLNNQMSFALILNCYFCIIANICAISNTQTHTRTQNKKTFISNLYITWNLVIQIQYT